MSLIRGMHKHPKFPLESLSKRELELLGALALGDSRAEVAKKLNITTNTYDDYRKSIRQKLRINTTVEWGYLMVQLEKSKKGRENK